MTVAVFCFGVDGHRVNVVVVQHLKDEVLVALAEGGAKGLMLVEEDLLRTTGSSCLLAVSSSPAPRSTAAGGGGIIM